MKIFFVPPKNNYPDRAKDADLIGQGMPYVGAALKKAGHQINAVNLRYRNFDGPRPTVLARELVKAITEFQPEIIALGGLTASYRFIADTMALLRHLYPDLPILLGGGIITHDRKYIFEHLRPDFAICGDAEELAVRLINALERNRKLDEIENLAFWRDGKSIYTPIEYPKDSLEDLAYPDYDTFAIDEYFNAILPWQFPANLFRFSQPRILPISMGRSCPFHCTFCCHAKGQPYRQRSVVNVIEEIRYFYDRYEFNILFIYDELFSLNEKRLIEFCDQIESFKKDSGADFDWTCATRVEAINPRVLSRLVQAGCVYVGVGFESGSDEVLESMRKGIKVKQIETAIKRCESVGIGVQANFIFGDRSETQQTMRETYSFFLKHCKEHIVSLGNIVPFPGSELFEWCIDNRQFSKPEYYRQYYGADHFRLPFYNMTEMALAEFIHELSNLMAATAPENPKIDLPVVWPSTWHAVNNVGRLSFRVSCPHCEQDLERAIPKRTPAVRTRLCICSWCHRRFVVDVSNLPLSAEKIADGRDDEPDSLIYKNYHIFRDEQGYWGFLGTFAPELETPLPASARATVIELQEQTELRSRFLTIQAKTPRELKELIDHSGMRALWTDVIHHPLEPRWIKSYLDFTVLEYGDKFWALSSDLGSCDIRKKILLGIDRDLNEKRLFQDDTLNGVIAQIQAFVGKHLIPDRDESAGWPTAVDLWSKRLVTFARLKHRLRELRWHRIALFGAGQHTRQLIKWIEDAKTFEVACILDRQADSIPLNGYPVIDPEQLPQFNVDALILSTDTFEDEMTKALLGIDGFRSPVFSLYRPEYAAALWLRNYCDANGFSRVGLWGEDERLSKVASILEGRMVCDVITSRQRLLEVMADRKHFDGAIEAQNERWVVVTMDATTFGAGINSEELQHPGIRFICLWAGQDGIAKHYLI
ncbi:MAG: radical SAM protein [Desulfobacterales bacterium]|nr:MAG: radical SAM protein [Desulfobacterales bacterium]